jgi:hypothetical protein
MSISVSLMRLKTFVKDGRCKGQGDLDELGVAVAGGLDRCEILVADGAAGLREFANEAGQGIALGIAGRLAIANVLELVGLQSCKLGISPGSERIRVSGAITTRWDNR